MSRYVFNCSMAKMIEIFTNFSDHPMAAQNFFCEKIDNYHYLLKARSVNDNSGFELASYSGSKKYFSIKVELSSMIYGQQQISCKGNTKRLKKLTHSVAGALALYYFISESDGDYWIRLIFFYGLSYLIIHYSTKILREEIVLDVRKWIIRKTFIKGNRRR